MKRMKSWIGIILMVCLLLSGCTPAAYDAGQVKDEEESQSLDLKALDIMQYQSLFDAESYISGADTTPTDEQGKPYKIAWCINDMSDEQMAYEEKCAREYAQELGIEFVCFDGQSDPLKQIDQINQSIIQQCDAVIVTPIDASAQNIAMKKAMDHGLKVICSTISSSNSDYYDVYVGPSDITAGQQAASMMMEALPDGGQVAVIQGQMGTATQINRDAGFEQTLENYPEYEIIAQQTANWSTVEAMNVMESYLAKYPDLKAVFCHNDTEALGAVQAIQNTKRNDIKVIGIDGMQSALNLIAEDDCFFGTSMQPSQTIAQASILACLACINGEQEQLEKEIYTDNVCIVAGNATKFESGWGGE